jgi:hypothetical protein
MSFANAGRVITRAKTIRKRAAKAEKPIDFFIEPPPLKTGLSASRPSIWDIKANRFVGKVPRSILIIKIPPPVLRLVKTLCPGTKRPRTDGPPSTSEYSRNQGENPKHSENKAEHSNNQQYWAMKNDGPNPVII